MRHSFILPPRVTLPETKEGSSVQVLARAHKACEATDKCHRTLRASADQCVAALGFGDMARRRAYGLLEQWLGPVTSLASAATQADVELLFHQRLIILARPLVPPPEGVHDHARI
jgi:hypothetical protein